MPVCVGSLSVEPSGCFLQFDSQLAIKAEQIKMSQLLCHNCGYEPENEVTPPKECPKCRCTKFERISQPGSLFENALRHRPKHRGQQWK